VADGRFHSCARWGRFGMACPFVGEEDHDDDQDVVPVAQPVGAPKSPKLLLAARAKAVVDQGKAALLAEAEEIVTRAAEAIPLVEGRSLAKALRERGPLAVGVGAAAGLAIRAVAKGFAGGGFHFPQVFDPARVVRVR